MTSALFFKSLAPGRAYMNQETCQGFGGGLSLQGRESKAMLLGPRAESKGIVWRGRAGQKEEA